MIPHLAILFSIFLSMSLVKLEAYSCEKYLLGLARANEDVPEFGGLNPSSPVTRIANLMLRLVPRSESRQIQMAVPVSLFYNVHQPQQFGDGVQNSNISLGPSGLPPFVSLLVRGVEAADSVLLALRLSKDFPGLSEVTALEFSILGERKTIALDSSGLIQMSIDPTTIGWNRLSGMESIFFRPVGWNDWFSVQFPQAYLNTNDLMSGMAARYRALPSGQSIVDPLGLRGAGNPEAALQQILDAQNLGFAYARAEPRVHGFFVDPSERQHLTATGIATTRYRLPHVPDFAKLIYLAQRARDLGVENAEGLVSGTGPHRIGSPATAEIILNSLGDEPLLTFHGIEVPARGPGGDALAWRAALPHLYIGTWLPEGRAFVASQGTYHQHLTHTSDRPAFAQVLTPPQIPSEQNHFGFPRH